MRKRSLFAVMVLLLVLSICLVAAPVQAATYAVTVQVPATGGGMVSANECNMAVKVSVKNLEGTNTVTISAITRNADCTFTGWTTTAGTIADATNPTTTIEVTDKATVTAGFTPPANSTLTVKAKAVGNATVGTVKIVENGLTTITRPTGTKVTIEATPFNSDNVFFGWSYNMGLAAPRKAVSKVTMCGTAEEIVAYFVPLTTSQLKLACFWQYEVCTGRQVDIRTHTKVAESGGVFTSILTMDKPEISYSNDGTSTLGFPVGASRLVLESGSLQTRFWKATNMYNGRDVRCDLWYWDSTTSPYYYGGPAAPTQPPVMIGMPVTVYTDGFSGGTPIALTADANNGQRDVEVATVSGFFPGETVTISDNTPLSETCVIAAVGASRLVVANVAPGVLSPVTVLQGGGYAINDDVTLADLTGTSEVCNIFSIIPNSGPGVDTLIMSDVANSYFAAAYPSVTLNRLTMDMNLTNNYTVAKSAQVAKPGAAGLPYTLGKTFNYVEHQGIFYKIPLQVTVMDKEMVRVPAGLFECWKVVTKTMDMTGAFTVLYRIDWYSEKVKMSVKSEYYIYAQHMDSANPTTLALQRVQTEVLKKYKINPTSVAGQGGW
ncbi:MAG: hypothetical protein FJ012_04845 [Chloroflexi bacterium]|nr:hypothetical protein [Chloroflexota bacterium]